MRAKLLGCAAVVFALVVASVLVLLILSERGNDFTPDDDEVGLVELQRFAQKYSISVSDFEQPTIWVQLSSEARKDPRGPCVTVCYQTRKDVNPRHILLLYLTPQRGIIDEESLVEDLSEGTSQDLNKQGTNRSARLVEGGLLKGDEHAKRK
jgi:hypothetical protein